MSRSNLALVKRTYTAEDRATLDAETDRLDALNGQVQARHDALIHRRDYDADRLAGLAKRGVFTYKSLQSALRTERRWVIDGLIADPSVNLLVGDSNAGKTPFNQTLGICVATGTPFFGRTVKRGRVLFLDAESGQNAFHRQIDTISATLGLDQPPEAPDFMVWSPNWSEQPVSDAGDEAFALVEEFRPDLVIVDPLRSFWAEATGKDEDVMDVINAMRATRATWIINHHRRKPARGIESASLTEAPHEWMQDSAGSYALVSHTDTRIGVERVRDGDVELQLCGFVRAVGPIAPMLFGRIYDDVTGAPWGYRLAGGEASLKEKDRAVYRDLPERFRFADVQRLLGGNSGSNPKRLIELFESKQLARESEDGKGYVKVK